MAELFNVCYRQPYSHPKDVAMCHCIVSLLKHGAPCLKPGKPFRLVTTKLSSNITLVHYSQTGRISILTRIFNHGVLLLSYQESVSTLLTKSWNSIYWLSQPIQKHHPTGCHPTHPIGLWHCLSTSSLLKLRNQISNPIVGSDMVNWNLHPNSICQCSRGQTWQNMEELHELFNQI